MDRKFLTLFAAALLAMTANAQTQAGAQAGAQADASANKNQASGNASASSSGAVQSNRSSAAIADGTAINASLSSPVDSKKAKEGDEVNARTTEAIKAQGKTVLPKGTKLVGHVTRATARGKGDTESALGIAFDKAILKGGEEIPLSGNIQALAAAQSAANVAGSDADAVGSAGAYGGGSAGGGGRGALGGATSAAGGTAGAVTNTAGNVGNTAGGAVDATARTTTRAAGSANGAVGGLNAAGQLASNSRGVFGLNGLNLNAAGANSTQGSLITSTGKNVHLDSGTRMLIVSGAQAGDSSASPQAASKPEPKKMSSDRPNNQ
jgi:hypothetical protein